MRVAILGGGYVGLVAAACFASVGHHVVCFDTAREKIADLKRGIIPIYEPGLESMIKTEMLAGRLHFTVHPETAMRGADAAIIAVGTPPRASDGHADTQFVLAAARMIALHADQDMVIVTKSTVPLGTGDQIALATKTARPDLSFSVVSNPEFLREGTAIDDFLHPDRIVIGSEDLHGHAAMDRLYAPLADRTTIVHTDRRSAEVVKYAANAFLAMKITFMNEIADLSEVISANIRDVETCLGLDTRIGPQFLRVGPGYGGSCFPKDTLAITKAARAHRVALSTIEAVIQSNQKRKKSMAYKALSAMGGSMADEKIAVLGLTFKADTDDIRESPAIALIQGLLEFQADVHVHDPQGMTNTRQILPQLIYCGSAEAACADSSAVVIATEWRQFRSLDLRKLAKSMNRPVMIDLRNLFSRSEAERAGFVYHCLGEGAADQQIEPVPPLAPAAEQFGTSLGHTGRSAAIR